MRRQPVYSPHPFPKRAIIAAILLTPVLVAIGYYGRQVNASRKNSRMQSMAVDEMMVGQQLARYYDVRAGAYKDEETGLLCSNLKLDWTLNDKDSHTHLDTERSKLDSLFAAVEKVTYRASVTRVWTQDQKVYSEVSWTFLCSAINGGRKIYAGGKSVEVHDFATPDGEDLVRVDRESLFTSEPILKWVF